jgi:DNA (cytosine-5)-methyltransferase 1
VADRGQASVGQPGSIIDLFAGPGGWEEGLQRLGYRALGIDADRFACESAEAAGHKRLLADVTSLDLAGFDHAWGLIASPPCQAYSSAGKRLGKLDKPEVIACARELCRGEDTRAFHLARCRDGRSLLTVEPLRWALALRPRWVAMEQMPPVAELWSIFAELLEPHGYHCAVGLLSAERYGVPQARKRAFLIASLDGAVQMPAPTHRSFHPLRHSVPAEERDLPSWVSMADALGWSEPAGIRTNQNNFGASPESCWRSFDRPCYTLLSSSYLWTIEAPPPGARSSRRRGEAPIGAVPSWAHRRPATTLLGDARVTAPASWPRCGRRSELLRGRPVRVSVEQAGVLQGFRHDYPWQGSRTRRFQQIGNAVCPPVAARVLEEAMRPSLRRRRRVRGA